MSNDFKFRAIPSIDILQKKVVRLHQGDFNKRQFYEDPPLSIAQRLADAGHRFLHLVDLDGAKAKQVVNMDVVHQICNETPLKVDFGGGLRTDADVSAVFALGVSQITAGTVAVTKPEMVRGWIDEYGPDRIILGADVREDRISIGGWIETSEIHWKEFLEKWQSWGIKWVISTDVSKDGALNGPSMDLYRHMVSDFPDLNILASGGVSNYADIDSLIQIGMKGVIIGKALHDGIVSAEGLVEYNHLILGEN